MKENQIKLNQIITQKEMLQKKRGSLHALNNSFKRNTLLSSESANKYESSYQCKLPQTNFNRRDLSIILRYILYKEQMQISDRNLLRRILLSIFDEELISAGTKKFIHFLKMEEGSRGLLQEQSHFYFVLKGKGIVWSGAFTYNINQGDTFGHVQILSQQKISKVSFESKYILLKLQKKHFNQYFRAYYEKIYQEKESQVQCIKQSFIDQIPLLNKYLFFNKIQYKHFSSGEKIVCEGQIIKNIYFLTGSSSVDMVPYNCIGLYELLRQRNTVRQSIYCNEKITLPYADLETFNQYVFNNFNYSFMNESNAFEKLKNKPNNYQTPQKINNFMKIKRVKLKLNPSRLKTDVGEFYETNFKFFKPLNMHNISLNPQKPLKQSRPLDKRKRDRYQKVKNYSLSRPLRNNYF